MFSSSLSNSFLFELIIEFAEQIGFSVYVCLVPLTSCDCSSDPVLVPLEEVDLVTSSTHSGGQVG